MVRCAGTTARTIHGVKVSNLPWCLGESGVMSLSVNLGNPFQAIRCAACGHAVKPAGSKSWVGSPECDWSTVHHHEAGRVSAMAVTLTTPPIADQELAGGAATPNSRAPKATWGMVTPALRLFRVAPPLPL